MLSHQAPGESKAIERHSSAVMSQGIEQATVNEPQRGSQLEEGEAIVQEVLWLLRQACPPV